MQKIKISTNSSTTRLHEQSHFHINNLDNSPSSPTTLRRLKVLETTTPLSPAVDTDSYPLIPARRFFISDPSAQPNLPTVSSTNRTERWVQKTSNESGVNMNHSRSDVAVNGPRGRSIPRLTPNQTVRSRETSPVASPIQNEQPLLRDLLGSADILTTFLRKQSWFESHSTKTKPWRERFAVLLPTELHLFRDNDGDCRAYASMPITANTSVTRTHSSSLYILDVECPAMPIDYELWRLQFNTESEMLEWHGELLNSIEMARKISQNQRYIEGLEQNRVHQRVSNASSASLEAKSPRHERSKFQRETRESDTSTSTLAYDGLDPYPYTPKTPRTLMATLSLKSSDESLNPFQGRRNSGDLPVHGSSYDVSRTGSGLAKSLPNLQQIREDVYMDSYGEDEKPRIVDPVEEIARLRKELEVRDRRVKELEGSLQRQTEKKKFGFLGKGK
ncbi:hypothetical protein HK096_007121 [Nowakowskiella sp. JEL0078]|nr:hypothetical protein HK096_007121 [Nowakowskiella sp. JEL0078]